MQLGPITPTPHTSCFSITWVHFSGKSHQIRTKLAGSKSLHTNRSSHPPPPTFRLFLCRLVGPHFFMHLSMRDVPLGEKEINFIPLNSARLVAVVEGCHSPGPLLSPAPRGPGVGTWLPWGQQGQQFPYIFEIQNRTRHIAVIFPEGERHKRDTVWHPACLGFPTVTPIPTDIPHAAVHHFKTTTRISPIPSHPKYFPGLNAFVYFP